MAWTSVLETNFIEGESTLFSRRGAARGRHASPGKPWEIWRMIESGGFFDAVHHVEQWCTALGLAAGTAGAPERRARLHALAAARSLSIQ
jgi:hypothetical protein